MPLQAKPFLKWAGGKGRLLAQYQPYLPSEFKTYFEPFLGGAAVFFHLAPARAVLTDINPELINLYTCVRDQVEAVIQLLAQHKAQHCDAYYYQIRALPKQQTLNSVERAARILYLNKTCFNGLYRENALGHFNVPMGRYRNPQIYDPNLLRQTSDMLRVAEIAVQPFQAVLETATPADFVYFDPPYQPISATSSFTAYSRFSFCEADQIALRDVFAQLQMRGVRTMLSNSDCPFIRDLYADFRVISIEASRAINSRPDRRGKVSEVLVLSW
ncbi:DNA adenine methylase [Leptolyngbya sp. FACHB-261]|uniref:DNA adenine methylase n=1 Tax=Leptolyngbya sp. FACHB-261 TaxID=2692806 RepID=UPI001686B891|nr:DNA adenine methylase [Leptolyngbya sp. FACHB-261]MBD2103544.1 DNA adenine methylase [Leptolyngbya sp. FACHB-261]